MPEKYKNKYRINSSRLRTWDYKKDAAYFITICTKDMISHFGKVANAQMQLNELGKIAEAEWLKTFELRPDMNLLMGEYVIMPNHFHAIIIIGENQYNSRLKAPETSPTPNPPPRHSPQCDPLPHYSNPKNPIDNLIDNPRTDAMHCVSSNNPSDNSSNNPIDNPIQNPIPSKNQFGPQSKNLASIIRGFKIGVTTRARPMIPNFAWQPRFHERIIRDDRSFQNISNYIKNNPANWHKK